MSDCDYGYDFDNQSVISDISESSDTFLETFQEIYRYKVVYPGGTYIRISPALNAEKTKTILKFGDEFEASKSIVLDGVNYVKLSDDSGWVFARHHDKEVLQLIDCIRIPIVNNNPIAVKSNISFDKSLIKKNSKKVQIESAENKAKNNYWKEVRTKVMDVKSFNAFKKISLTVKLHPSLIAHGPALSIPSDDNDAKVLKICNLICRIASVARQCTNSNVAEGLEAALWLLVHLGSNSRVTYVLTLAVEASNQILDELSLDQQSDVLSQVLEVSSSSRKFFVELAKLVNFSETDIGNFLQRWMMLQITKFLYRKQIPATSSSSVNSDLSNGPSKSSSSNCKVNPNDFYQVNNVNEIQSTQSDPGSSIDSYPGRINDKYQGDKPYNSSGPVLNLPVCSTSEYDKKISYHDQYNEQKIMNQPKKVKEDGFWKILTKELGFL